MIINGKMAKFAITNIHLQMIKQKQIAVLGSTGSIGTQTLDIINEYPDKFRASVLVAGSNVEALSGYGRNSRRTKVFGAKLRIKAPRH